MLNAAGFRRRLAFQKKKFDCRRSDFGPVTNAAGDEMAAETAKKNIADLYADRRSRTILENQPQ